MKPHPVAALLLVVVLGPGVADAGAGGAAAKRKRCKHRTHKCAVLKRVRVREPLAERLWAAAPGKPGGGSSGGGGGGQGSPPDPLPRSVSVSAREFSFTLSRPLVGAGSVSVELRNVGEDPHNLVISPDDGSHLPLASWTDTGPGERLRKSVTLAAGRYQLWCSLLDHESQGMSVDLVVQ
jgi:hypothetical protein